MAEKQIKSHRLTVALYDTETESKRNLLFNDLVADASVEAVKEFSEQIAQLVDEEVTGIYQTVTYQHVNNKR